MQKYQYIQKMFIQNKQMLRYYDIVGVIKKEPIYSENIHSE